MTTLTPTESGTIRTREICRHYTMGTSVIRAVDGISFSAQGGEFIALLGSSGSGKSSLLNLIAGLDRPTSGDVQVDGHSLAELSSEELARYRRHCVGMVFQSFNLVPSMTVAENVELPLRLAETERHERAGRVREALDQVGLSQRLTHRPGELSGGEQQRVALARALVNSPRILLADEPTGNLDSHTGLEIMERIRDCNQRLGMTVLLVTHERALAERFAHRMLFLADGKLVADQANPPHSAKAERHQWRRLTSGNLHLRRQTRSRQSPCGTNDSRPSMRAQVQVSEGQELVPIERRHRVLSLPDVKGDGVHDGLIECRHLVRAQAFCIKQFVNGARRHRRHKHSWRVCPLIFLRGWWCKPGAERSARSSRQNRPGAYPLGQHT